MRKSIYSLLAALLLFCVPAQAADVRVVHTDTRDWPTLRVIVDIPVEANRAEAYSLLLPDQTRVQASSMRQLVGDTDRPGAVVIALDTSKSLDPAFLEAAKRSLTRYADRLGGDERLALLTFNDDVYTVSDYTTSRDTFTERLGNLSLAGQSTELYRAMLEGIRMLQFEPSSRTLLVVTDGHDEERMFTRAQVLAAARDNGVRVLVIGLPTKPGSDPDKYLPIVEGFANHTGGLYREVNSPDQINAAVYEMLVEQRGMASMRYELLFNLDGRVADGVNPVHSSLVFRESDAREPVIFTVPGRSAVAATETVAAPLVVPTTVDRDPALSGNATMVAPVNATGPVGTGTVRTSNNWWWLPVGVLILGLLWLFSRRRRAANLPVEEQIQPLVLVFPELNRSFPLKPGTMIVGSSEDSDIRLSDPSLADVHAEFCVGEECRVRPLEATRGVLLNGKPVRDSALLKPGDVLQFGEVEAMVRPAGDGDD